jgi:hypothetical protein
MTLPNPVPDFDRVAAQALQEVLSTQFQRRVEPALPGAIARAAGQGPWLTARVDLVAAALTGCLRLELPEAWLLQLNASLQGGDPAGAAAPSDLADLAGELCNMTAGRIAARLAGAGGPSQLGTPAVVRGPLPEPEAGPAGAPGRSCWTCDGQVLRLTLTLGPPPP